MDACNIPAGCTINEKPIGRTEVYVRIAKGQTWYRYHVGMLFGLLQVDNEHYEVFPVGPFFSGGDGEQWMRGAMPNYQFGFYTGGEQGAFPGGRYVEKEDADLIYVDQDTRHIARVLAHDGRQYDYDGDDDAALWQYFATIDGERNGTNEGQDKKSAEISAE